MSCSRAMLLCCMISLFHALYLTPGTHVPAQPLLPPVQTAKGLQKRASGPLHAPASELRTYPFEGQLKIRKIPTFHLVKTPWKKMSSSDEFLFKPTRENTNILKQMEATHSSRSGLRSQLRLIACSSLYLRASSFATHVTSAIGFCNQRPRNRQRKKAGQDLADCSLA